MRFVVRIHQDGWSFEELAKVWRESDRLGYDGASLYDVLGIDGPECWTALTALTAATQKLIAWRHPRRPSTTMRRQWSTRPTW
jgi:hypothetical protein